MIIANFARFGRASKCGLRASSHSIVNCSPRDPDRRVSLLSCWWRRARGRSQRHGGRTIVRSRGRGTHLLPSSRDLATKEFGRWLCRNGDSIKERSVKGSPADLTARLRDVIFIPCSRRQRPRAKCKHWRPSTREMLNDTIQVAWDRRFSIDPGSHRGTTGVCVRRHWRRTSPSFSRRRQDLHQGRSRHRLRQSHLRCQQERFSALSPPERPATTLKHIAGRTSPQPTRLIGVKPCVQFSVRWLFRNNEVGPSL